MFDELMDHILNSLFPMLDFHDKEYLHVLTLSKLAETS